MPKVHTKVNGTKKLVAFKIRISDQNWLLSHTSFKKKSHFNKYQFLPIKSPWHSFASNYSIVEYNYICFCYSVPSVGHFTPTFQRSFGWNIRFKIPRKSPIQHKKVSCNCAIGIFLWSRKIMLHFEKIKIFHSMHGLQKIG